MIDHLHSLRSDLPRFRQAVVLFLLLGTICWGYSSAASKIVTEGIQIISVFELQGFKPVNIFNKLNHLKEEFKHKKSGIMESDVSMSFYPIEIGSLPNFFYGKFKGNPSSTDYHFKVLDFRNNQTYLFNTEYEMKQYLCDWNPEKINKLQLSYRVPDLSYYGTLTASMVLLKLTLLTYWPLILGLLILIFGYRKFKTKSHPKEE